MTDDDAPAVTADNAAVVAFLDDDAAAFIAALAPLADHVLQLFAGEFASLLAAAAGVFRVDRRAQRLEIAPALGAAGKVTVTVAPAVGAADLRRPAGTVRRAGATRPLAETGPLTVIVTAALLALLRAAWATRLLADTGALTITVVIAAAAVVILALLRAARSDRLLADAGALTVVITPAVLSLLRAAGAARLLSDAGALTVIVVIAAPAAIVTLALLAAGLLARTRPLPLLILAAILLTLLPATGLLALFTAAVAAAVPATVPTPAALLLFLFLLLLIDRLAALGLRAGQRHGNSKHGPDGENDVSGAD
jgi:hypothetical protein